MAVIFKVFKWAVSMAALICAIAFLNIYSDTSDIKYMAVVLPCLAFVFWFSKTTYEASKPVMLRGFGILAAAGLAARFGGPYLFAYTGIALDFFWLWTLATLAVGLPAMYLAFKKDA